MLHKFDPAFFQVSFFCESCPRVQVLFFWGGSCNTGGLKVQPWAKICQSCPCVIPSSLLFLSASTCCHLRKLRRDYCNWPTPTWNHWSLRWTNCTAEYTPFTQNLFYFLPSSVTSAITLYLSNVTFWTKKRLCNR